MCDNTETMYIEIPVVTTEVTELCVTTEQFMPKIDGESYRCRCGCNVFRKVVDPRDQGFDADEVFVCNVCHEMYATC